MITMKDKFIRVLSPITAAVILLLDFSVIAYGVFAVKKVIELRSAAAIFFAAVEVAAIIIAFLVTKETLKNGVVFREDEFEFTGLDDNNIFDYSNIENVESFKDTTPSLVKNFVDRHSVLTLTLKEDKVVTIDIGLSRKYTLDLIHKEICQRCGLDYVPPAPIPKYSLFKKGVIMENEEESAEKEPTEGNETEPKSEAAENAEKESDSSPKTESENSENKENENQNSTEE